jgi:hypothetical protein
MGEWVLIEKKKLALWPNHQLTGEERQGILIFRRKIVFCI